MTHAAMIRNYGWRQSNFSLFRYRPRILSDALPANKRQKRSDVYTPWSRALRTAHRGSVLTASRLYEQQQPTKNYPSIVSMKLRLSQALLAQDCLPEAAQIALEGRDE